MNNRPFFILGSVHSGISLLSNILRKNPKLIAPKETHFYRWAHPFGSEAYTHNILKNPTLKEHRRLDGVTEVEMETMLNQCNSRRQLMVRYMGLFINKNGRNVNDLTWFDHTPHNIFGLPMLAKDFPAAKFVCLVRNPLNVIAKIKKNNIDSNLRGGINHWNETQSMIAFAKHRMGKRLLILKYEAFLLNPEEELGKLFAFLELEQNSLLEDDIKDLPIDRNVFLDYLGVKEINHIVNHCAQYQKIFNYNLNGEYKLQHVEDRKNKNQLIEKWLPDSEEWNDEHFDFLGKDYLEVICSVSAKSGSTSLYQGFLDIGHSSLHIHGTSTLVNDVWKMKNPPFLHFSYFDYLYYLKQKFPEQKVLLIDVVREPVSRKIAAFFQNISLHYKKIIRLCPEIDEPMRLGELVTFFEENTHLLIDVFNKYFLLELEKYNSYNEWQIDGVEVYSKKVDTKEKIWIEEKDWKKFLILRFDQIKKWPQVFEKMGYKGYKLPSKNTGDKKDYGKLYKNFKEQYRIPKAFLDLIYNYSHQKMLNHFFSESEIKELYSKWNVYQDKEINELIKAFDESDYKAKHPHLKELRKENASLFHYCCFNLFPQN